MRSPRKAARRATVINRCTAMTTDRPDPGAAPPERKTLRCRTVTSGALTQLNWVRDLPPLRVEEWIGPTHASPTMTPSEILLVALGSCLSARIHANAASGSIVVRSLASDVAVE